MKTIKRAVLITFAMVCASIGGASVPKIQDRPNILWLTCEDISPHLGCYGDAYAYTPTLDALGENGVIFTKAFAAASVCTPTRSSLITGLYASSVGTQHLRAEMVLSKNLKCYPEYLREAGYYCSNNAKQDYNFVPKSSVWDDSNKRAHWRNRKPGQPFFSVFNYELTHQSKTRYDEKTLLEKNAALPEAAQHRWQDAPVPPYYPDTREVKSNIAALHTQITLLDSWVKGLLDQLKEDGLADDTIVFFYSDHGDGLPRHKRWLHDTGTRVPFILHVPKKYQALSPFIPGSVSSDLVSFMDFPPTVLALAGAPIPEVMKGNVLLNNKKYKKSECIFTIRDRVDENYIFSRGAREERFHYIRNFFPLLPRMPYSGYSEITPIRKEIRRLHAEGKLTGDAAWLVQKTTPIEELYDTEKDPFEMNNLAMDKAYAKDLKRMQKRLKKWMIDQRDLSLIPESEMVELSGKESAYDTFHGKGKSYFEAAFDAADKVGKVESIDEFIQALNSDSDLVQFWSLNGLIYLQSQGATIPVSRIVNGLTAPSEIVRIKTAELILWQQDHAAAKTALLTSLDQEDTAGKLQAVISIFRLFQHDKIAVAPYKKRLTQSPHKRCRYTTYMRGMTREMYPPKK